MKRNVKNIFLTGLAVLLPLGLTFYILKFLIELMDSLLRIIPDPYRPDLMLPFHIPGLGLVFAILFVFIAGLVTTSYVGNRIVRIGERILHRIPFVRNIYQAIKQISDSMFRDANKSFKKAVLIRFPSRNAFSIAFVTGVPNVVCGEAAGERNCRYVGVFMPTSPNPTTGLYMMIPEDELIDLPISIEEAFTLIVSAGIVIPQERPERKNTPYVTICPDI